MAHLFNPDNRRVLPNWRPFGLTAELGELGSTSTRGGSNRVLSISDYIADWDRNKEIAIAADLLSAAFANGLTDDPKVRDAAMYVLSHSKQSADSLQRFAEHILNPTIEDMAKPISFEHDERRIELRTMIRTAKDSISLYPENPIQYVELARLYAISGRKEKALRNMGIALRLATENRFVLRAAARLYAHFRMTEQIYNVVRRTEIVKHDPWVMSTEIALATILGKSSRLIKRGFQIVESCMLSPLSTTELAASLGTVEFFHGNRKRTSRMLRSAMISPNDNSLAQTEWISNMGYDFPIDPNDYEIETKYEALTLDNFYNSNFEEALRNSIAWFCDMPFSKSPVMFCSHIASSILNKAELGIDILMAGLESHPNDQHMLNNLAFTLALENKLDDAEKYLDRVSTGDLDEVATICITATNGLIAFRRHDPEKGRKLYLEAIRKSDDAKNSYLKTLAMLNFVREEILHDPLQNGIQHAIEQVRTVKIEERFPDAIKLRNNVLELYNKIRDCRR